MSEAMQAFERTLIRASYHLPKEAWNDLWAQWTEARAAVAAPGAGGKP
jgi:hypothetical protein